MLRFSFFLLLATAAAPALAQADQERSGRHHRGGSSEQSETRPQRTSESRSSETREPRPVAIQRTESSSAGQRGGMERMREHFQQRRQHATSTQSDGNDQVRVLPRREREEISGQPQSRWRERERRIRTIPSTQPTTTVQPSTIEHGGFQGRSRRDYRDGNYNLWSNNWRHDRRYDWDNYRRHHRSIFRLGFYHDPFGWNYRRWWAGSYLYPSYYGSSFWMNDPWKYRLPPAYGPYRWVRYWDDALLVNIYTGQVVDVIHSFFW